MWLHGYPDAQVWYELAFTLGLAHGMNTLADGLFFAPEFSGGPPTAPLLPLADPLTAPTEVTRVLDEAQAFFAMEWPPAALLAMAHDPASLAEYWLAFKAVFADGALDRFTKEVRAFAVSVTAGSADGTDFHLREMRRLGAPERAVVEALQVTQLYNGFTKIADTLRLTPDFLARP